MFKKILFIIILTNFTIFTFASLTYANELKPFVTDYCTMFVDGTSSRPTLWRDCCVEHDIRYWFGGTNANKDKADTELKACVKKVAGITWANLIYVGVRAGHFSPIKGKYKWSWGWENKRNNNEEITDQEKSYIKEELRRLPYSSEMIEQFIQKNF